METVYNRIVEVFNANPQVFTDQGLPQIRQIDIHMGQPDDPEEFEVICPAVFIDWSIEEHEDDTEPDVLNLDFHVLQEPGAGTENYSSRLPKGLEYMRVINACQSVLNKLRASNTTPFKRRRIRPAITPFFRYHVLSYYCSIDAYSDSIHRPTIGDGSVEKIVVASGALRKKDPRDIDIETYR